MNILKLTDEQLLLLKNNNISIDIMDNEAKVLISDLEGNFATGIKLSTIVANEILDEIINENVVLNIEEEEEYEHENKLIDLTSFISNQKILEKNGYIVNCESPLEIEATDGNIANGLYAILVASHIRN
jgi:hypothetical protein